MKGPGLFYVAMLATAAYLLGPLTAPWGLGASFLAILLGLAYPAPERLRPGIDWAAKPGLLIAIVLLGFQIDVRAFSGHLWKAAAIAAGCVALAFALAPLVRVKRTRALLLGAGFGICGVAAIATLHRAVGADEEDVAFAVPTVTLAGAGLMLAMPLWQAAIGLDATAYGVLAGAVLPAVPQAIGAGFASGATAGIAATSMKMARVTMLPILALAVGLARKQKGAAVPWEVIGFFATATIANVTAIPPGPAALLAAVSQGLLLAALVALGNLTTWRVLGGRAWLMVGALLAFAAAVALL